MARSECEWIMRVSPPSGSGPGGPACEHSFPPLFPAGCQAEALLCLALLGAAAVLCLALRRRRSCGYAREQMAGPATSASPSAEMRALCCCPDAGVPACSASEAPSHFGEQEQPAPAPSAPEARAHAPPAPLRSAEHVEEQPAPAPSLGEREPGQLEAEPETGVPRNAFFLSPRFRPVPPDFAIGRPASPDSISYTTCTSSRTQSIQVRLVAQALFVVRTSCRAY